MKNRQTRIILLIMVGLVLFSSSLALLMYTKQKKAQESLEKQVDVFVAAKNLHEGDLIGADAMLKVKLPESYLNFKPLSPSEIMGRYATDDILSREPFRKEKISIKKPQKLILSSENNETNTSVVKQKEEKKYTSDTLTISLSLFKNIDTTLKKGDFIDIVSLKPKKAKNGSKDFAVKYVALHVPIYSFVNGTRLMENFSEHVGEGKNATTLQAQSIILETSPKDIKNLLSLYYETQSLNKERVYNTNNSGHLWIVKCAEDENATLQEKKKKMLVDYVPKYVKVKRRKKVKERVSISYEK